MVRPECKFVVVNFLYFFVQYLRTSLNARWRPRACYWMKPCVLGVEIRDPDNGMATLLMFMHVHAFCATFSVNMLTSPASCLAVGMMLDLTVGVTSGIRSLEV